MIPRSFHCDYACFSIAMLPGNEREDVERGGKSKYTFLRYCLYNNFNS